VSKYESGCSRLAFTHSFTELTNNFLTSDFGPKSPKIINVCEIGGSHFGDYEECCLLGCEAMYFGRIYGGMLAT
jgi:hypothetical protein